MTYSQLVLLGLIGLFIVYIVRMRSAAADRLMYLGLAALGIGLVLNPELTNRAAAALGIGRGADLMFYFFIVFCLFHFAATAATLRRLQHDLGELTRALALQRAAPPADQSSATPPFGG